jgi:hypothetical protein
MLLFSLEDLESKIQAQNLEAWAKAGVTTVRDESPLDSPLTLSLPSAKNNF